MSTVINFVIVPSHPMLGSHIRWDSCPAFNVFRAGYEDAQYRDDLRVLLCGILKKKMCCIAQLLKQRAKTSLSIATRKIWLCILTLTIRVQS
jgi:hypothetical protein